MAFRRMIRSTEKFSVAWPDDFTAQAVTESDATLIGAFLLRIDHPLHRDCEKGTLEGATYYATRLFDYHRNDPGFAIAVEASTLVQDSNGTVVGTCLIGGGGEHGTLYGVYAIVVDPQHRGHGIGTSMIHRALTVLSEHGKTELDLWRNDDNPASRLYDRLGFTLTGQTE